MATTTKTASAKASKGLDGIVDTIQNGQKAALDSTRRIVETINNAVPDITEDGPRSKVIDAAFNMTGQVVDASSDLTRKVLSAATPSSSS